MKYLLIFACFIAVSTAQDFCHSTDAVRDQLSCFLQNNNDSGILTADTGVPVQVQNMVTLGNSLIHNQYFIDAITHVVSERIPNRIVHAAGIGAHGYFEVTHDITDICKAKVFDTVGKQTPVKGRFSPPTALKGAISTVRDARGLGLEFDTEDGLWDLAMFNTPMFFAKDPLKFEFGIKSVKRVPKSNVLSSKILLEMFTKEIQEGFNFLFYVLSDYGNPFGYQYAPQYSIHTYQLENSEGVPYFARFHFVPDSGIKNLNLTEGVILGGVDPHYMSRKFYNDIASGNYPTWTLNLQVLTLEQVKNASFDVFDLTMILPIEDYPLRPVGKLVFNRNPENQHAEIELASFCPGTLVPGILGAPDKMFESRILSYKSAQQYRIGINHRKIPAGQTTKAKLNNYDRDGVAPVNSNGGSSPNYYPNSFNGPKPVNNIEKTKLYKVTHKEGVQNQGQVKKLLEEFFDDQQRLALIETLIPTLLVTDAETLQIFNNYLNDVSPSFAEALNTALAAASTTASG